MDVAIGLARRTVSEMRRVLAGLRPTVLDDFGLARGLRAYADGLADENLTVAFSESIGTQRLDSEVEIALFRLAQEALTNVRKHARVREAALRLNQEDDQIVLEVEDGGSGFDLASLRECDRPGERLGLLGMRERIAQVGGSVEIRSRCGEGTLVRAVVPVSGLTAGRSGTRGGLNEHSAGADHRRRRSRRRTTGACGDLAEHPGRPCRGRGERRQGSDRRRARPSAGPGADGRPDAGHRGPGRGPGDPDVLAEHPGGDGLLLGRARST